jgi:hypothetical protein
MGTQLSLPAGWALALVSLRDSRGRLDRLLQDQLVATAEIRVVLDRLAERNGLQVRDVDRAMLSVDDTLCDLLYDVGHALEHEIEHGDPV